MANLLKKFGTTETAKNRDGGYKALVFFAPVDSFSSIKAPTVTTALGDKKKISTAHTFGAEDGFISLMCKIHSVKSKSGSVGDDGVKSLEHEFEFIVTGDSAEHLEQFETTLNERSIFLLKDQDCINATDYVQFGDDCLQPTMTVEFDSMDTSTGIKNYKVSGKIKGHKYFYTGTVTEKP